MGAAESMSSTLSPLELPGWLEFNAWRHGLKPLTITRALSPNGPEIRAVLYLDKRGRVKLPRGNPYLPVSYSSVRRQPSARTADWHQLAAPLVDEMRRRGSANQIYLSPDVEDVRPWQWCGFQVVVRYTYYIDFPFSEADVDRQTRRSLDRGASLGLTVDRVTDVGPVIECLADTEQRRGFAYGLGTRELAEAVRLVGYESLRMYVCSDRAGNPASALVVIHSPGARALQWLAGTKAVHLRDGASHLAWRASLVDLAAAGATGIDLCGANMASVAAFKSHWGARLVSNYGVRTYSLRTGARFVADWLAARDL